MEFPHWDENVRGERMANLLRGIWRSLVEFGFYSNVVTPQAAADFRADQDRYDREQAEMAQMRAWLDGVKPSDFS